MTELKTLKDITHWTCECNCITFDNGICRRCKKPTEKYGEIDEGELKQEAIKWIKKMKKDLKSTKIEITTTIIKARISWIKHFFNITDEDLK